MLHYMYIITIGFSGWNAPQMDMTMDAKPSSTTGTLAWSSHGVDTQKTVDIYCQHKHHHPEASVETSVTPQRIYNLYLGVSINGDPLFWMVLLDSPNLIAGWELGVPPGLRKPPYQHHHQPGWPAGFFMVVSSSGACGKLDGAELSHFVEGKMGSNREL